MSEIAIKVEGLGKRYRIGRLQQRHDTLRDRIADAPIFKFLKPRNGNSHNGYASKSSRQFAPDSEELWALRDISFEVKRGEVVGLIGRNGAGKSTLLKVLSRITEPTEGFADIKGRIGSLLEVGTGFHPELTGRENIFLNGSILGMKRVDINRKFDEIVAFAEVEKFIDTPVKHYSSGMYVRLAFAVAAHLEPEILVVDEVLAVGDAAFQKKCLGKMGEVAREGRTVMFVSHNMAAVVSLCNRALLLESGQIAVDGPAAEVASVYQTESIGVESNQTDLSEMPHKGSGKARFTSIKTFATDQSNGLSNTLTSGDDLMIETTIKCSTKVVDSNVAIIIYDANGYRLIDANTALKGTFLSMEAGQEVVVRFTLSEVLLRPASYYVGLWIGRGGIEEIDSVDYARRIDVVPNTAMIKHTETFPGVYRCNFSADVEKINA
jgi:lipopolysaccharide transport system ATP-binding protein